MSLMSQEVTVGQIVNLNDPTTTERIGMWGTDYLSPAEPLRVTRVYSRRLIVRSDRIGRSYSIDRSMFERADPNAPASRRLGQKPEGDDLIDVDDPRIQWLFDDMGQYANEQDYCAQYDLLCARLGIPGRRRDFRVKHTLKGMEFVTTVKARSQREANEKVKEALGDDATIDPDFAPAA